MSSIDPYIELEHASEERYCITRRAAKISVIMEDEPPRTMTGQHIAQKSKPNLLVIELWGLGDLVIATPFLQAASRMYAVSLLAKPYAKDLQPRFWPGVEVITFVA